MGGRPRVHEKFCPKCDRVLPVSAFDRYSQKNIKPYCRVCGTTRAGAGGLNKSERWRGAHPIPGQPMGYEKIARVMGLTKQGVSYIEQRALAKLRARASHLAKLLEGIDHRPHWSELQGESE